jgi:hypothetical protein
MSDEQSQQNDIEIKTNKPIVKMRIKDSYISAADTLKYLYTLYPEAASEISMTTFSDNAFDISLPKDIFDKLETLFNLEEPKRKVSHYSSGITSIFLDDIDAGLAYYQNLQEAGFSPISFDINDNTGDCTIKITVERHTILTGLSCRFKKQPTPKPSFSDDMQFLDFRMEELTKKLGVEIQKLLKTFLEKYRTFLSKNQIILPLEMTSVLDPGIEVTDTSEISQVNEYVQIVLEEARSTSAQAGEGRVSLKNDFYQLMKEYEGLKSQQENVQTLTQSNMLLQELKEYPLNTESENINTSTGTAVEYSTHASQPQPQSSTFSMVQNLQQLQPKPTVDEDVFMTDENSTSVGSVGHIQFWEAESTTPEFYPTINGGCVQAPLRQQQHKSEPELEKEEQKREREKEKRVSLSS